MRYAYVKANNVVAEAERVLQREGQLPEGGPDAYVAHFLGIANDSPALLISTHFRSPPNDCRFRRKHVEARSFYWYSRGLRRFGKVAQRPLGTFVPRALGAARIFAHLVRFRPDRVLCWASSFALWATYFAARVSGAVFVYCQHTRIPGEGDPWYQKLGASVDRWIIRRAHAVIAHGPYLRQQMMDIGVDSSKLFEFNWSFRHFFCPAHEERPTDVNLCHDSKTVLFIGRLQKSKGVFDLLDAVTPRLRNDRSLMLVYAGDGGDRVAVERLAAQRGMEAQVRLLGHIAHDRLPSLIAQCRFVVTPTRSWFPEGRCMATMEGLVMGKPVIAPDFGPFPFLVTHNANGLLFKADSVEDLGRKIGDLLDDDELYRRLVQGARKTSATLRAGGPNFGDAVRSAFSVGGGSDKLGQIVEKQGT